MSAKLSDKESNALMQLVEEQARLQSLTNRALVFECLSSNLQSDDVIEEMMTRLYPRWAYENEDGTVIEE